MSRWAPLAAAVGLVGCSAIARGPDATAARPAAVERRAATDPQLVELRRQAARAEAEIRLLRQQLAALQVEVERLAAEPVARAVEPARPAAPAPPEAGGWFETTELEPVRVPPPAEAVEPEVVTPPPAMPPPPMPAGTAAVPPAGQAIYDRGYTLYHQGRYLDAESSFQRFLQAYADTELADNAQFWIGESRFARDDFMGALLAFQEVLDRHPGGNKLADALLKVGDCLVRLDNLEGARQRYEEVTRRFPGSAAAAMAEERLGLPPG
ncbi:MAG: tol-pal system protein YbgF [Acidobacteriota bacterium]|nr:tol-pal system protein YbgF [Acidobacteriota bacterium]MDH3523235.1 tol-pal system protein YbgF [Acidobacteriota bacterium]